MAEHFLGEIKIFTCNFAPKGWAFCDGQSLPNAQFGALFGLLKNTFGGDATHFKLPDLRARVPIHVGNNHTLGQTGGEPTHTLVPAEMPKHAHYVQGTASDANLAPPKDHLFAQVSNVYTGANNLTQIEPATVANAGGGQAHENMQPFLVVSYCIAITGHTPQA